jgi:signal transduction histidine kinase/ligand-binding sensor domain-containing protein
VNSLALRKWQRRALQVVLVYACVVCGVGDAQAFLVKPKPFESQYHNSWTVREGIPSFLWHVAQTSDGFLWLASETGLYRFDGLEFTKFYTSHDHNSNSDNTVTALLPTADGGLWTAYRFGGADFIKGGAVTNYPPAPDFTQTIYALVQDQNNNIWGATAVGLMRFDGVRWSRLDESWGVLFKQVMHLRVDPEGTLWVDDGASYYTLPRGGKRFRATHIRSGRLAFASDGNGWVAVDGAGLFRMRHWADGRWTEGQFLMKENISTVLTAADGSLWIGAHDGVWRVDPLAARSTAPLSLAATRRFDKDNGLTDDYVYELMEDHEGSIWAITQKGLDQFRNSPITSVDLPAGMLHISILSEGNGLLVGSAFPTKLPLMRIDESGVTPIATLFNLVQEMYLDRTGAVWLNAKRELWLYSKKKLTQIPLPPTTPTLNRDIQTMTLDESGTLWVSFVNGGVNEVYRYAHGDWSLFRSDSRFPKGTVITMFSDSQGQVWMGFNQGRMAVVTENKTQYYGKENGLHAGTVFAMAEHGDHLWIGGTEGLDLFSKGKFQQVVADGGARLSGITGIVEAENGDLWLNCALGSVEIDASELKNALDSDSYRVRMRVFNYLDGYGGAPAVRWQASTLAQTQNRRIYFASSNDVSWIDPYRIHKNTVPPRTFITSATVDGQVYEDAAALKLSRSTQNIQINYTATSLLIPQRVQFRYKLEGFDRDWQRVGTRRQAFYSRLPPGHYSFHVLASNNDGVWSTSEATLQFSVPPAFFETWWFRWLCVVALALLFVVAYLVRIRRLAAQIRNKLVERLAERERIARDLHDTFFQNIQGLLLRFNTGTARLSPDEPARQILMEALVQSDRVMAEGRELVLDLSSTITDSSDLPDSLARAGEEFKALGQSEYKVIVSGGPRPLHPVCSTELSRLGREAIYNAFRHAHARTIEAELVYQDDSLNLRIRDNGIGIDEQVLHDGGRAGHRGMLGIKERSNKLGAKLSIWSQRGSGTEIEVSVAASVAYLTPERKTLRGWFFKWVQRSS